MKLIPVFLLSLFPFPGGAQNELKAGAVAPEILFKKSFPDDYKIPNHKPVILDFWDTSCAPCVGALIESNYLVEKYANQIEFIAITYNTSRKVEAFIKKRNFKHKFIIDKDTITFRKYGVYGIPHAFIIDTGRIIRWAGHSRNLKEEMIEEFLATNRVAPSKDKTAFKKDRFDRLPISSVKYKITVLNRKVLKKHQSIVMGETDNKFKGSYSNAPESEGCLTVINFSLSELTERTQPYFRNIPLKCDSRSSQGYDFIKVPFSSFEEMNKFLRKEYGIAWLPVQ